MNQRIFVSKARSIFSDNAGIRKLPHQRSGKFLDEGRLGLVPAGETRVFQRPIRRQFAEYHICILLDCSGSMQEGEDILDEEGKYVTSVSRLEVASLSTHALAYSLKHSGARVDVIGFNSRIKLFDPKLYENAESFYGYTYRFSKAFGNDNCDATAIKRGREFLMKSPAAGKILLVLSDGVPTCVWSCAHPFRDSDSENEWPIEPGGGCLARSRGPERELKHQIKLTHDEKRIELLSVGIMTDEPVKFYGQKKTRVISHLSELYSEMANMLEKNIIRG